MLLDDLRIVEWNIVDIGPMKQRDQFGVELYALAQIEIEFFHLHDCTISALVVACVLLGEHSQSPGRILSLIWLMNGLLAVEKTKSGNSD